MNIKEHIDTEATEQQLERTRIYWEHRNLICKVQKHNRAYRSWNITVISSTVAAPASTSYWSLSFMSGNLQPLHTLCLISSPEIPWRAKTRTGTSESRLTWSSSPRCFFIRFPAALPFSRVVVGLYRPIKIFHSHPCDFHLADASDWVTDRVYRPGHEPSGSWSLPV